MRHATLAVLVAFALLPACGEPTVEAGPAPESTPAPASETAPGRDVVINHARVSDAGLGFRVAGVRVGGALDANASGGGTGVFINGRELRPLDALGLQQLVGAVAPGRYWLDPDGNAGVEGGPAIANLRAAAQGLYQQGSGVGENYTGGGSAYGNLNTGIGILTDGEGGAAVFDR